MEVTEPQALHGEALNIEPQARPISAEDEIRFQRNRIAYLRSTGQEWTEALFHLRDTIVGLEDPEFWDGVPEAHRVYVVPRIVIGKKVQENPNYTPERAAAILDRYAERGWRTTPCRHRVARRGGQVIRWPDPTPGELSQMLRIINALLARRGMTWRWNAKDEMPKPVIAEGDGGEP